MKMSKKFLAVLSAGAIMTSMAVPAFATEASEYTIDTPYQYPVTHDSDEWKSFQTRNERLAACHVDAEVLQKMTTSALVETVLNYPMLADMYAYDTLEQGIKAVSENFSGIEELEKRDDAVEYLQNRPMTMTDDEDAAIISARAMYLTEYLDEAATLSSEVDTYMTQTTVKTPKGTAVSAYKGLTWSDHGVTKATAVAQRNDLESTYTNATRITDVDPAYNCHSYA